MGTKPGTKNVSAGEPGLNIGVSFHSVRTAREVSVLLSQTLSVVAVHLMIPHYRMVPHSLAEARRFVTKFLQSGSLRLWVPEMYCPYIISCIADSPVPGQILVDGINVSDKIIRLGYAVGDSY